MDGSEYMTSLIPKWIYNFILPGNCWLSIRRTHWALYSTRLFLWFTAGSASTLCAPGWCVWYQDTHYQFQGTEILRILCRCLGSRVLSRVAVICSYFNFWGFKVLWTIQLKYLTLKICRTIRTKSTNILTTRTCSWWSDWSANSIQSHSLDQNIILF